MVELKKYNQNNGNRATEYLRNVGVAPCIAYNNSDLIKIQGVIAKGDMLNIEQTDIIKNIGYEVFKGVQRTCKQISEKRTIVLNKNEFIIEVVPVLESIFGCGLLGRRGEVIDMTIKLAYKIISPRYGDMQFNNSVRVISKVKVVKDEIWIETPQCMDNTIELIVEPGLAEQIKKSELLDIDELLALVWVTMGALADGITSYKVNRRVMSNSYMEQYTRTLKINNNFVQSKKAVVNALIDKLRERMD